MKFEENNVYALDCVNGFTYIGVYKFSKHLMMPESRFEKVERVKTSDCELSPPIKLYNQRRKQNNSLNDTVQLIDIKDKIVFSWHLGKEIRVNEIN